MLCIVDQATTDPYHANAQVRVQPIKYLPFHSHVPFLCFILFCIYNHAFFPSCMPILTVCFLTRFLLALPYQQLLQISFRSRSRTNTRVHFINDSHAIKMPFRSLSYRFVLAFVLFLFFLFICLTFL